MVDGKGKAASLLLAKKLANRGVPYADDFYAQSSKVGATALNIIAAILKKNTFMEKRVDLHLALDQMLDHAYDNGARQVVELGKRYTPLGVRQVKEHDDLVYIATADDPYFQEKNEKVIDDLNGREGLSERYQTVHYGTLDSLLGIPGLDTSRQTAFVTEGLPAYLPQDVYDQVIGNLVAALEGLPAGSSILTHGVDPSVVGASAEKVNRMVKNGDFHPHFAGGESEARDYFAQRNLKVEFMRELIESDHGLARYGFLSGESNPSSPVFRVTLN